MDLQGADADGVGEIAAMQRVTTPILVMAIQRIIQAQLRARAEEQVVVSGAVVLAEDSGVVLAAVVVVVVQVEAFKTLACGISG